MLNLEPLDINIDQEFQNIIAVSGNDSLYNLLTIERAYVQEEERELNIFLNGSVLVKFFNRLGPELVFSYAPKKIKGVPGFKVSYENTILPFEMKLDKKMVTYIEGNKIIKLKLYIFHLSTVSFIFRTR